MPAASPRRFDLVIVGAGAAGLAAAGELSQAGLRVVLLEARARLGGRAWTQCGGGWPIPRELGAEFVHGRDRKFFAMLHEAGLSAIRVPESRVERVGSRLRPAPIRDQFDSLTRRLAGPAPGKGKGKDRSVAEELRRRPRAFSAKERRLLTWMIESYDAAPLERASARALSTAGEPPVSDDDRAQFRLADGYGSLVDWLASRVDPDHCEMVLSAAARRIEWRRGRVRVATSRGHFQARRALVTVPIGVLRAPAGSRGAIVFDPDPPALRRAVSGLDMGDVVRLLLRFREPFWRDAPRVRSAKPAEPNFFHFPLAPFPTWWTCAPVEEPVLTAWVGGPPAASLRRLTGRSLVRRALESFASGIGVPLRPVARGLLDWDLHDWTADPYARGAYSYALVGGASAGARLLRPIDDTLFFAGKAIGDGDSGTVPAAIASGRRAARRILQ